MNKHNFTSFDTIDEFVRNEIKPALAKIDSTYSQNFRKVLHAFQKNQVSEFQLHPSYGYGLWDPGTTITESVFSTIFHAEKALVRPQITSGTQALFLILNSLLKKDDVLLCVTGPPYETLKSCIGIQDQFPGNLLEKGVQYKEINMLSKEPLSKDQRENISKAKLCWIQKSRGYSLRYTISNDYVKHIIESIRAINPSVIIAVDNCYGEFTEIIEPIECGADVCAGSFMKNPGAGIARTGAYIVGSNACMDPISSYLVAPGLGYEFMPNLGFSYEILQGLFHAPLTVKESLYGNIYLSCFLESLGFSVHPHWNDPHYDIVLEIQCKTKTVLEMLSTGVQKCSPIDSHVKPDPFKQNGYEHPIVMAGGSFVPGSSIEFSADGFFHEPYYLYYQPGLYAEQSRVYANYIWKEYRKL